MNMNTKLEKQNRRTRKRMALILPGILTAVMVLSLLVPDKAYSNMENRPLEQVPSFELSSILSGKFQKQALENFSDQIPGRELLIHGAYLTKKLMGITKIDDVYLGKNALIQNPPQPDQKIIQANAKAIQDFASSSGIHSLAMVIPTAAQIQPNKLPNFAPVFNQKEVIDGIYQSLQNSTQTIDVLQPLSSHQNEYIFYRTDHHWTSLGAWYAFQPLISAMGFTPPELKEYQTYLVDKDFTGSLARKTGSIGIDDQIYVYQSPKEPDYVVTYQSTQSKTTSIFVSEALSKQDSYEVFLGANQGLVTIETAADTGRNLLMFKDSFANTLVQFLVPYFDSITIVDPRMYYEDLKALIEQAGITDALFVYNYSNFVSDSSLSDLIVSTWPTEENASAPAQPQENPSSAETAEPEEMPEDIAPADETDQEQSS